MTSERGLWSTVQPPLSPFLMLKRMENKCDLGTPDVAWTGQLPDGKPRHGVRVYRRASGWLELKECEWPKRPETPLHIPKLTLDQVLWQEGWEKSGGRVATLIQAGRDYLIVPPAVLREILRRRVTRAGLRPHVLGSGKLPVAAIIKRLFE